MKNQVWAFLFSGCATLNLLAAYESQDISNLIIFGIMLIAAACLTLSSCKPELEVMRFDGNMKETLAFLGKGHTNPCGFTHDSAMVHCPGKEVLYIYMGTVILKRGDKITVVSDRSSLERFEIK